MHKIINYSVFALVAIAVYEWGSALNWELDSASKLKVFPLLGLVAFSIMWWHFLLGFVSDVDKSYEKPKGLKGASSIFVFFLIILHPTLLFLQSSSVGVEFREFVELYVGDTSFLFVHFGTVAFFIFLAYDLAKRLKDKPLFKKNWLIIDAVDDVAFILVFIHSMMLGTHTANGWFRYYWITLGISGLFFIGYKHWKRFRTDEKV